MQVKYNKNKKSKHNTKRNVNRKSKRSTKRSAKQTRKKINKRTHYGGGGVSNNNVANRIPTLEQDYRTIVNEITGLITNMNTVQQQYFNTKLEKIEAECIFTNIHHYINDEGKNKTVRQKERAINECINKVKKLLIEIEEANKSTTSTN
jgi:hypothetical protein